MFNDRTLTSFGISIGTGLTLESLFTPTTNRYDPERVVPITVDPNKYKIHYYNIYTIIRNILTSISNIKDKDKLIEHKDFKQVVLDEILVLESLYDNTDSAMVIYQPKVRDQHIRFNNDKSKSLTKSFIEFSSIESKIKNIEKDLIELRINFTKEIDKSYNSDYLVFTHYLLDFNNLNNYAYLLESHTGKIKSRSMLNSKYHQIGKRDLSHLPYNTLLHYILGDKTLVVPLGIGVRVELYNLSIDNKWNTSTTKAKIHNDFNKSELLKQVMLKHKFKE